MNEGGRDSKARSAHKFVLLYETEVETSQMGTLVAPLFVFAVSTRSTTSSINSSCFPYMQLNIIVGRGELKSDLLSFVVQPRAKRGRRQPRKQNTSPQSVKRESQHNTSIVVERKCDN